MDFLPLFIGLDGGATKMRGAIVKISENGIVQEYSRPEEITYREMPQFLADFQPVPLPIQFKQLQTQLIELTPEEIQQGMAMIEAATQVILRLLNKATSNCASQKIIASDDPATINLVGNSVGNLILGIGLPGLKTSDRLGIAVMANGPRIPNYAQLLTSRLTTLGIILSSPIAQLGSDADYCGIGENYSQDGKLQDVKNAYYLGIGTGIADAMKLEGELIPFDLAKPWIAKSWEILSQPGLTMEKVIAMPGIWQNYCQQIAMLGHETAISLPDNGHAELVLTRACEGDTIAKKVVAQVAEQLAKLIYDRIATLAIGGTTLEFANPQRTISNTHERIGKIWQRIVIGQRMGYLWQQSCYHPLLKNVVLDKLHNLLQNLPDTIRDEYQKNWGNLIVASPMDAAPILGAALSAFKNISRYF